MSIEDAPPAGDDAPPPYLLRIAERVTKLGITEAQASIQAFGHRSGIKNMRSGTKSPGIDAFTKLAPILKTSPAFLAFGNGEDLSVAARDEGVGSIPVIGEVAAGVWLETDTDIDAVAIEGVALSPNPRWPAAAQFVVVVRGTSINRVAEDGAALACVDTRAIRYRAQDGDLVIVERREGAKIERTAKRYRRNGDAQELWPDSTDPKWTKPMVFRPDDDTDESVTVEIIGLADKSLSAIRTEMPWTR